jgi:hypothetical protein
MTNNSLTIYLEDLTTVGSDDETTIIFTQNMNRIMMGHDPEKQPAQTEEHNEQNQEQLPTHNDPFTHIVKTMKSLPDSHAVWEYIDPTRAYFTENLENAYLEHDARRGSTMGILVSSSMLGPVASGCMMMRVMF